MNKYLKKKITKKRKGGKKNCKTICKNKFIKEIKQDTKYKAINKISSFFSKNKYKYIIEDELNKVLDSKDIQDDEVFKDCVKECKK